MDEDYYISRGRVQKQLADTRNPPRTSVEYRDAWWHGDSDDGLDRRTSMNAEDWERHLDEAENGPNLPEEYECRQDGSTIHR
jgi:hypothetical protein